MSATSRLLYDLETLAGAEPGHRAAVLRRIEALFAASGLEGVDSRSELFDAVLSRLAAAVDARERAAFAARFTGFGLKAPQLTDLLARDPDPDVAVPVLSGTAEIGEPTLIACARDGGQLHLLALSRRSTVSEAVSDVIVERGDEVVLFALTENMGVRFSSQGFVTLVRRVDGNDSLVSVIARRRDVAELVAGVEASGAATPDFAARVRSILHAAIRHDRGSLDYAAAIPDVERLMRIGRLDENVLRKFAEERSLPHTIAALAALSGRASTEVEAVMLAPRPEPLLAFLDAMPISRGTRLAILAVKDA